jgi:hypothetical protein
MAPDYSELPVAALRSAARDIEQAVAAGNRTPELTSQPELTMDSEIIRQAVATRAARSTLIDAFRDTGHISEKRDGLIWILRTRDYKNSGSRLDKDREALLVMGENNNRWSIYEGIINANNFPPSSLGAIQLTFHEARLEFLSSGQKFEDESRNQRVKGQQ